MKQQHLNYTKYPIRNRLIYNGATIGHYTLGAVGIILGYNASTVAWSLGSVYFMFAVLQMYLLMPLTVCPDCVYYGLDGALCVTGLNVISRRIAERGNVEHFPNRARGFFCHNNLYMAALIVPVIALVPGVIVNFSPLNLIILGGLIGLLLYRIFVIFPRIACVHCCAKNICPNAQSMGLAGE